MALRAWLIQFVIGCHCHSTGTREAHVFKQLGLETQTTDTYIDAIVFHLNHHLFLGLSWKLWTGVRAVWL